MTEELVRLAGSTVLLRPKTLLAAGWRGLSFVITATVLLGILSACGGQTSATAKPPVFLPPPQQPADGERGEAGSTDHETTGEIAADEPVLFPVSTEPPSPQVLAASLSNSERFHAFSGLDLGVAVKSRSETYHLRSISLESFGRGLVEE